MVLDILPNPVKEDKSISDGGDEVTDIWLAIPLRLEAELLLLQAPEMYK